MNIDEIYHFFCKATGCRILNGRKDFDKTGNYTCINAHGSSVIYLVFCTTDLFDCIHKFTVHGANIV